MSYTINISKNKTSKKELTEAEIAKKNFNKMSATDRINKLYDMLMDHEARISALEPTPVGSDPTPEQQIAAAKTYNFTSYSDKSCTTQYATGTFETTGVTKMYNDAEYTEVEVTNNTVEGFNGEKYYIISDAQLSLPPANKYSVYQLYEYDEANDALQPVDIWVTITQ